MDATDRSEGEDAPQDPHQQRIRVLVVDDHDVLAGGVAHVIDAEPDMETVGIAGTVAQARDLVVSAVPDVVLLDHSLPDGPGVDAIPGLRGLRQGVHVVVLTASTADEVLVAALEHGATGFVTKTRSLGEVTSAVRAAAAGEAVIERDLLARLLPRLPRGGVSAREELTAREHDVLLLLAEGLTNAVIASRLALSVHTVRNHIAHLCHKLGAHSKLEALSVAMRLGLLPRG